MTFDPADIAVYLDHLKALSFVDNAVVRTPSGKKGGVTVDVTARRKKYTFDVGVLHTHLSMAEVERWIGKAKSPEQKRPLLVLAPYVSRPMGARLREAGVQYLDQLGNMHLALNGDRKDGAAFVALVEGKSPIAVNLRDGAWRAPSYQVLLAFLIRPALLGASVRAIATQAGVSTSPVLQVQKKLVQQGFAFERRGEWQWTPRGWTDARDFWLHGYHATLRPHLLLGRFRARAALAPTELEKAVDGALRGRCEMYWGRSSSQ